MLVLGLHALFSFFLSYLRFYRASLIDFPSRLLRNLQNLSSNTLLEHAINVLDNKFFPRMNFCQLKRRRCARVDGLRRYHYASFVRRPNRSARAFVSDALGAIYTRRARGHACVRRGWIQSGFALGGDGWERKMAFADSRYPLFSRKSSEESLDDRA